MGIQTYLVRAGAGASICCILFLAIISHILTFICQAIPLSVNPSDHAKREKDLPHWRPLYAFIDNDPCTIRIITPEYIEML